MSIRVSAITEVDVRPVAGFLHAHLNRRIAPELWACSMQAPWQVDAPNAGFVMLDDETIVGAYIALYSERRIDGRAERFCNLGAWCVLPEYRAHSLRLLRPLLAQEHYHFTDLSPTGDVAALNARLRFRFLDTTTAVVPNLPWPSWPRRDLVSSDREDLERALTGRDLELYRDHARARAALHVVLVRDGERCYVMLRRGRRRGLRIASVLHVSNPELLRRMARPLARHLLTRHATIAMLAEDRIVKYRPQPSFGLRAPPPKMFRSPYLEPDQIDDLYSELACLPA
jgi:hypothetical protein